MKGVVTYQRTKETRRVSRNGGRVVHVFVDGARWGEIAQDQYGDWSPDLGPDTMRDGETWAGPEWVREFHPGEFNAALADPNYFGAIRQKHAKAEVEAFVAAFMERQEGTER